jgi:IS5 family transposase
VLITDHVVTPAAVHDSQVLPELVGPQDQGQSLWAHSANKRAPTDAQLKRCGVDNQIHEKSVRRSTFSDAQKVHNRQKSRTRCLVKPIFGYRENSMQGPELEFIGLARISTGFGLANLPYNLCRYAQLIRFGRLEPIA